MEDTFNPKEYIKLLGEQLVVEFQNASRATQSVAVGSSRETSARNKLKAILPAGVGIGSGFVIDSFGQTSRQCDIILYEENYAMKFAINDDYNNIYINCENVIAVGEVKSDVNTSELEDSLYKLSIIKKLKKYNENGYRFRKLFDSATGINKFNEVIPYDQTNDKWGQIYTFLLCQNLNVKTETIFTKINEICKERYCFPNRILSVNGAYIGYLSQNENQFIKEPSGLDSSYAYNLVDNKYSFNYFINDLLHYISNAQSVPLNYSRYIIEDTQKINKFKELIKLV